MFKVKVVNYEKNIGHESEKNGQKNVSYIEWMGSRKKVVFLRGKNLTTPQRKEIVVNIFNLTTPDGEYVLEIEGVKNNITYTLLRLIRKEVGLKDSSVIHVKEIECDEKEN